MKMEVFACLLFFSLSLGCVLGHTGVPVLLWKDAMVPTMFKPALAGHTLSSKQFESRYLDGAFHSEANNLVLFIQNKLSLEDITKYGNVYGDSESDVFSHVKKYMLQPSSVSLPAVESPLRNLDFWSKQFEGTVTKVNSAEEAAGLQLKSGRNLVVVSLPAGQGSRKDELTTNDRIIGKVMEKVKHDFMALYTAQQISDLYLIPESDFSGRHLLAVDESSDNQTHTLINKTGCPLVYFTDMKMLYREMNPDKTLKENCSVTFPPLSNLDNVKCPNTSTGRKTMEVTYTIDSLKVTFLYTFPMKLNFWTTSLNVTLSGKCPSTSATINKEFAMKDVPFEGPYDFSYHCNTPPAVISVPSGNFKLDLTLRNFQIQPFSVKNSKFGRPNECIGFFSIPIFMGLTVALVLLSVLLFGICMIADIKTNDQFDDPKGKTITVDVKE